MSGVRCPSCHEGEDRVVDSRAAEDGSSIRRRRQCLGCGARFTTFERVEEPAVVVVVKSDGRREEFSRQKLVGGVSAAAKGRPVDVEHLVASVEERLPVRDGAVASADIGRLILEELRDVDQVAYLRFASVYKDFEVPADFERELGLLGDQAPPVGTSGSAG